MNLSIVDWFGYNLSPQDRMRFIKDAGFDGVLLLWADYFDKDFMRFPEYAKNAVGVLAALDIIRGFEDNSFIPHNFSTRSQAVVLLDRAR